MVKSWIDRIERRNGRWRSRGLGGTWVVAVSGGGDSVGLLRVLHQLAPALGLRLSVAHLDHGARGEAARADAAFVAELAASLGLPLDLGRWQPSRAGHFEADARLARYDWLVETARARAAEVVALGHTHDDQAETILHRIVRGTGPHGLAGMPRVRVLSRDPRITLVRPLLDVPRCALRDHLAALGQPFRDDETNADQSRTRSRIRHDLLPKLAADYNPRVAEALVRLGRLAAASGRALAADVRAMAKAATITVAPHCVVLKHPFLSALPSHLRAEVLRRVWRQVGWPEGEMSARRWRRLSALVQQREVPRVEIGAGVAVSTEQFFLVLRRSPDPGAAALAVESRDPIALEVPGAADVPWAGGRVVATIDPVEPPDESIDRDRLALPLSIRPPLPGDRFEPLGMGGRSTPLADFFRGRHVPRDRRDRTPLVCDQLGIVWVVGHRIADRVKVTEQTRQTLGLCWEPRP